MPARPPHPWRYAALYFPMGLMIGYPSVALGYLTAQAGLPVSAAASIVGSAFFAHALKFLWAPLADYSLTAQDVVPPRDHGHGRVLLAAHDDADARGHRAGPDRARLRRQSGRDLRRVRDRRPDGSQRRSATASGAASGWFQSGNQFGQTAGGGLGSWLTQHVPTP